VRMESSWIALERILRQKRKRTHQRRSEEGTFSPYLQHGTTVDMTQVAKLAAW
jgi:hypothetical protein